ncbi:MAG: MnhB domain-containing protein [Eubacteriales bacterium]
MKNESEIITQVTKMLIPFIWIFGIYIVLGGADSVGGGFQGGAVLSSVFMLRYIIHPERGIRAQLLQSTEKIFMIGILLLALFFLARSMHMGEAYGEVWMVLLNSIIAVKVMSGLSIIFFRYVFYESKEL